MGPNIWGGSNPHPLFWSVENNCAKLGGQWPHSPPENIFSGFFLGECLSTSGRVAAPGIAFGTLKDGYVRTVPLPRIPRIQSASHDTSHELITPSRCIQTGTPLPDYLRVSSWIPTLPKLGSLLGFSQRIL